MRKPFFDLPYAMNTQRMSISEVDEGIDWLKERMFLIRCEDDDLPSIDWVLKLAKAAVLRHGIRGLIIDPYNEVDHQRPKNMTETEYVSGMLSKVCCFATPSRTPNRWQLLVFAYGSLPAQHEVYFASDACRLRSLHSATSATYGLLRILSR